MMALPKVLYLLRGVPGAGKSTLAQQLSVLLGEPYFEADMYHLDMDGVYQWQSENLSASHAWCERQILAQLQAGKAAIVANTFSTEAQMAPYLMMAQEHGYQVHSLVVENRHGGHNQHQVDDDTILAMKQRFEIQL